MQCNAVFNVQSSAVQCSPVQYGPVQSCFLFIFVLDLVCSVRAAINPVREIARPVRNIFARCVGRCCGGGGGGAERGVKLSEQVKRGNCLIPGPELKMGARRMAVANMTNTRKPKPTSPQPEERCQWPGQPLKPHPCLCCYDRVLRNHSLWIPRRRPIGFSCTAQAG